MGYLWERKWKLVLPILYFAEGACSKAGKCISKVTIPIFQLIKKFKFHWEDCA